jgi:pimeloyl-ACP methyl ester carboxylesterase
LLLATLLSLPTLVFALQPPVISHAAPASDEVVGMVDVGGHRLFTVCMGRGSPTVLLQNGYAMGWEDWIDVQQRVAQSTRVCAFDRAGFGLSDPAPILPVTAQDVVADLHALTLALDEQGPFVLAGFSVGGLISRLYASTYPNDIAGIVLIESTPPEWLDQSLVTTPASLRTNALFRLSGRDPFNPVSPDLTAPETIDFITSAAQVRRGGALPEVPVISIVAGSPNNGPGMAADDLNRRWGALQQQQSAALGATQITAKTSGHTVPLTQPDLVAGAIETVVASTRGG